MLFGLYMLHQNRFRYKSGANIPGYLQITEQDVLVDQEVTDRFLDTGRSNHDFRWVDFETQQTFCV